MDSNQPTISRYSNEVAWAITNAMIDSEDDEIGTITLSCLVKIRRLIEIEVAEQLKEILEKEYEIQKLLNNN